MEQSNPGSKGTVQDILQMVGKLINKDIKFEQI